MRAGGGGGGGGVVVPSLLSEIVDREGVEGGDSSEVRVGLVAIGDVGVELPPVDG